jgi:hypothetical protein
MIALIGGMIILSLVIYIIPILGDVPMFEAVKDNLISSARGLNAALPIFALIIGVGIVGFLLQKR